MPAIHLKGQQYLVDELLKRDHDTTLEELLRSRRSDEVSYDHIARELSELIQVDDFTVSYQTIRRWCSDLGIEKAAS